MTVIKNYLSLVLGFLILTGISAAPRLVIQSGHIGRVNVLAQQQEHGWLLSAGEDGTVKIWQSGDGRLLYNIHLSYLPIRDLVVHPSKPQFAALVQTSLTSAEIIGYNWETDRRIFSLSLTEVPMFIQYSSQGSYFIYSLTEWDSLVICDSATGRALPYLKTGLGIVSFAATSTSEKRIMVYQPSGKILYKEILSGKDLLSKPLNAPGYLEAISISSNSRFIAAALDDTLVVVDLLSGETIDSLSCRDIVATLIKSDGTGVLCLTKGSDGTRLVQYSFDGEKLAELPGQNKSVRALSCVLYHDSRLFLADDQGKIFYQDESGDLVTFAENKLLTINDLAVSGNSIALGTRRHIVVVDLGVFKTPLRGREEGYSAFKNNLAVPVGVEFYKPNKLLVWNRDGSPSRFQIQDISSGEVALEYSDYRSPLVQVEITQAGILSLEHSGASRIIDKRTFAPIFQYTTSGLTRLAFIPEDTLIAARSKIGPRGSALLRINTETGETVALAADSLLCYDIVYDENRNRLYSLSIENKGDATTTHWKLHYGEELAKEYVLSRYTGEDTSASVVADSSGRYIYSSMGFGRIEVYDSFRVKLFAQSDAIPRKLYVAGTYLFSLNRDHSLTVWERFRGIRIADIYLLDTAELNWIALFSGGRSFASEAGWDYLNSYP